MPGITAPQRARRSRKPTGLPNPPMILLAGPEKTGKSREAAKGTASDLIGLTYWIEIGGSEGTADYYGRLPGANYEIVEHDGTYQDILDAVRWAVAQPPAVEGKRNMIVVDNVSVLWDMLSDEQALFARWRAERKAQENRRRGPNPDLPVTVDPDLWNRAKDRWGEILWHLRRHSGPTLLLARQELVTAFENDKPTRDKTRKIKAEKNLPAAVDAIVELHALGEAYLTGVRTLHWEVTPGQSERFDNFSIDTLLRRLGFEEAAPARQVTETRPEAYLDEQQAQQAQRPPQQAQQAQQQRHQRQETPPARQNNRNAEQAGKQVVELIHQALNDKTDPEGCLRAIRAEWGTRTLTQTRTFTKMWGELNADDLITRSLAYVAEEAEKRRKAAASTQGAKAEPGTPAPPPPPAGQDQAREHHAHLEPPAEDDAPPPPDPHAEDGPPPGESPEDTTEAEEPQHRPTPAPSAQRPPDPAAGRPPKRQPDRGTRIALAALNAEAEVQARVLMRTKSEHLAPVSEEGEPEMIPLRNYLLAQRPEVVAQLEREGHTELADYYREAPHVDTKIHEAFAPYFAGARSGQ